MTSCSATRMVSGGFFLKVLIDATSAFLHKGRMPSQKQARKLRPFGVAEETHSPPGTYTVIRDENGTKYTGKLEVYYGNGKISWVSDYRCGVRVGRANGTSSKREIYGGVLDGEDNSLSIEFTDNGFIQQGNSSISMTDKTKYKVERKVDITSTGFKWTTCVVNKDGSRTKVITGTATAD